MSFAILSKLSSKIRISDFDQKQKENELPKSFSETRLDRRGIFKQEKWNSKRTKSDTIPVNQNEAVLQETERFETAKCCGR